MGSTPAFLVTGDRVLVRDLPPHAIVHLAPHIVDGHPVGGRRERDVEVERVYPVDPRHFALDWVDGPFPGSSSHRRGTAIYGWRDAVTVIGQGDVFADVRAQQRYSEMTAGLAGLRDLIARTRAAVAKCGQVAAW